MTIGKGTPWGAPAPLPADGVVVSSDGALSELLEACDRDGRPFPVAGLLGGDLCRTLGGLGDEARLRGPEAMTFPVDLGEVLVDGRRHLFVAHVVARTRLWSDVVVAMNAQWLGPWNTGPKAHPNDGLLDVSQARLGVADRWKVRARLPLGSHLPHPGITMRRTFEHAVDLGRPRAVWADGRPLGRASQLVFRARPDALRIVI